MKTTIKGHTVYFAGDSVKTTPINLNSNYSHTISQFNEFVDSNISVDSLSGIITNSDPVVDDIIKFYTLNSLLTSSDLDLHSFLLSIIKNSKDSKNAPQIFIACNIFNENFIKNGLIPIQIAIQNNNIFISLGCYFY